jgi:hypothetical protein
VTFTANGNSISTLTFSIDYDETWLEYDSGAISFYNLPTGYSGSCTPDTTDLDGELDCNLFGLGLQVDPLPDGVFLTVQLDTLGAPIGTNARVGFSLYPRPSFGDTSGGSVIGSVVEGSVLFDNNWPSYLPLVKKDATPTPTLAIPPTTPPPPGPSPTPTIDGVPGFCTCTGPDLDCPDFSTHNQAQACFDHCRLLGYGDVYGLDRDNDGLACESLP